jgi:hypothetical protein
MMRFKKRRTKAIQTTINKQTETWKFNPRRGKFPADPPKNLETRSGFRKEKEREEIDRIQRFQKYSLFSHKIHCSQYLNPPVLLIF